MGFTFILSTLSRSLFSLTDICFFSEGNLANISIGVSDTSFSVSAPVAVPASYDLCTFQEALIPPGTTKVITCDDPVTGRYAIVQMRAVDNLELCEVEVYEERKLCE